MRSRSGSSSRVINLVALAVSAALSGLPAFAMETHRFEIPEESASAAIRDFGAQAHVQVLVAGEYVKNKKLHAVSGNLSTEQALDKMLEGSGLIHKYVGDGSIALIPLSLTSGEPPTTGTAQPGDPAKGGQDPSGTFLLAQAAQQQGSGAPSLTGTASAQSGPPIQEVIVTAEKKAERLMDVPVPVTAISGDTLTDSSLTRVHDYYSLFPGFSETPGGSGVNETLAIRGVSDFSGSPAVAVAIDGVPFVASTAFGGGGFIPDIDPGDLSHVEVLRGPQGTLYGASSMGGLLNFVTVDPSLDSPSARLQVGTNSVFNGAEPGYELRASGSIPINDSLGIRVSAYRRQDPGYVDNIVTNIDGVNEAQAYGGRVSALWRPSDSVALKVSALFQDTKQNGSWYSMPSLGDLKQDFMPGTGWIDRKFGLYSADLSIKMGRADLKVISSYTVNQLSENLDYTFLEGPFIESIYPQLAGNAGAPTTARDTVNKFTQEVRLELPLATRFDWLIGAFYTDEKSPENFISNVEGANLTTGEIVGPGIEFITSVSYSEYAAFTDLTYHVTDRFDIQLGGRESRQTVTTGQAAVGPLVPTFYATASPYVQPSLSNTANVFTYLLTPAFRISPDLMVYARLASGYRPGGPNINANPAQGVPPEFAPDKTKNYEVGTKGFLFDHKLSFDVSVYYIDWKNIQLSFITPSFLVYNGNGGTAKSEGVELTVGAKPLTGLSVEGWVSYDNAVLTENFPPGVIEAGAYGLDGDRLPFTSRFSANLSVQQEFPLWDRVNAFLGATVSYAGDRLGAFVPCASLTPSDLCPTPPPRQDYPSYTRVDLRMGMKVDTWTVNVFATNITDKRAPIGGGIGDFPSNGFDYIQPRTVGVSFIKSF